MGTDTHDGPSGPSRSSSSGASFTAGPSTVAAPQQLCCSGRPRLSGPRGRRQDIEAPLESGCQIRSHASQTASADLPLNFSDPACARNVGPARDSHAGRPLPNSGRSSDVTSEDRPHPASGRTLETNVHRGSDPRPPSDLSIPGNRGNTPAFGPVLPRRVANLAATATARGAVVLV